MNSPMARIAAIGECMVELQETPDGAISMAFGGDTFNAAAYMARLTAGLGPMVDYVSAIGDDPFSEGMADFWRSNGVGDGLVLRRSGRRPGLYFIKVDDQGERRFYYWRGEAAYRECFETEGSDALLEALGNFPALYLSGISLAVLRPESRERLLSRLEALSKAGTEITFDFNLRPILWQGQTDKKAVYERMIGLASRVMLSLEELVVIDVAPDAASGEAYFARRPALEVVMKDGAGDCTLLAGGERFVIPATRVDKVVDTTAAGDSFAGTYVVGRMLGVAPAEAVRRAHRVAGTVVQHRGAIIPADAVPMVFEDEIRAALA